MRAFIANPETCDARLLSSVVVVVTMDGMDLAKLRGALNVLTDLAARTPGAADIRNDLFPLLDALENLHQ